MILRDMEFGQTLCTRIVLLVVTLLGEGAVTTLYLTGTYSITILYPFIIEIAIVFIFFELSNGLRSSNVNYDNLTKLLFAWLVYWIVFIPFFVILPIGFIISSDKNTFFYYYAVAGFIFLSIVVMFIGGVVHLVLNLSSATIKSLFVLNRMEEWMKA
jgi:hypothetical protein